jgi:hypothetical protein
VFMKKYSWILALLAALTLAFAFTACGGDDDPGVDSSLKDLVISGDDIVLKHCGNAATAANVDGNKFILADQADLSNVGFYYEFPEEVVGKGYGAINIEMEVISIEKPDFVGLMTHHSSSFSTPVKVIDKKTGQQKTGEYDYEFKLGVECEKGAAGDVKEGGDGILDGSSAAGVKHDESYPFVKFTDRIAFQVNQYAGNITTAGWANAKTDAATYTIAVTKVTFVGGGVPDSVVDEKAIPGIIAPATGLTPVTAVGSSSQYTGTVEWAGTLDSAGKFALGGVYTATITLTAKEGFTLTGVAENFFTVDGATTVTNPANSGVVTAEFPAAQNPPAEVVLFDLAVWLAAQTEGEITGNLTSPLQRAGSPKTTKAGTTLVISDRAQGTWEGIDIQVGGFTFDYNTYNYTLTVEGYTSAANANGLKAGQTGSPYNEIGHIETDGTTTSASFTKPVPENDTGITANPDATPPVAGRPPAPFGNIRINSDVPTTGSYTLTKVILKGVEK